MQDFSGNLIETLSRLAFPKIGIIAVSYTHLRAHET